jgi:hypothetical protein
MFIIQDTAVHSKSGVSLQGIQQPCVGFKYAIAVKTKLPHRSCMKLRSGYAAVFKKSWMLFRACRFFFFFCSSIADDLGPLGYDASY